MGRIEIVRQDDNVTVLKGMATVFGSPERLDLSGEFFDAETWFGDDKIKEKFAIYDHAINDVQNPYADEGAPPDPIIGVAKFIEKDARGRWFEFEIERANEYHDYIMELHRLNRLGTSSRTLPGKGVKVMDPKVKGRIAKWPEVEVTLTPTPCDDATAFSEEDYAAVVGAMKSFAPKLYDEAVKRALAADLKKAAGEADKKEEAETQETEKPADPLAEAVEKLKADPVEETETEEKPEVVDSAIVTALQEKVEALEARLAASEASAQAEVKTLKATVETLQQHLTSVVGEATTLKTDLATFKKATRSSLLKGMSDKERAALGIPPKEKEYTPAPGAGFTGGSSARTLKSAFADNPDAPGS